MIVPDFYNTLTLNGGFKIMTHHLYKG